MPTKTGELVAKAANGDKNALAELYTTNFKSAFFPACGLLKNKQDALKAVINSFAKAFRNLSKLPKPDEFEDWIKQITVKHCIDIIKKKKGAPLSAEKPGICRVEIDSSFEFLPIDVLNAKELTSETIKTVNSMPDTQRICVYLCYYNGYSPSAAAKLISCTEDDVKWHLFAAREQIKNAVDGKTGTPTELSKMNGTSILSLVMELAKKELSVNSDTVKKSFFMACEKSEMFGQKPQTPVAPATPEPVYSPMPEYREPLYEPPYPPAFNEPVHTAEPIPQEQKKSKAPIIIVVIILLVLLAAGLAYWFIAKDNPDLPLPSFPSGETTAAADSEALNAGMTIGSMSPVTATAQNLKATVEDYDILLVFLDDVLRHTQDYDSSSSDAKKKTYDIMMNSVFTGDIYENFFDKSTYTYHEGKDPDNKLNKNVSEYYVFPAENTDWILTNVFNITPDHSLSSEWYYYKDGFYYVGTAPSDDNSRKLTVIDAKENSDGTYLLKIRCDLTWLGDAEPSVTTFFDVLAAFRLYEGRHYWSFYKMTKGEETEAPTASTTQAAIKNLTAKDADFKELTEFLRCTMSLLGEYDHSSSNAQDKVYNILLNGCFGRPVYKYFFGEPKYIKAKEDPLKKLGESPAGIIVYPAENIDWIIENVYCSKPDHSREGEYNSFYYHEGYYYVNDGAAGDYAREYEVLDSEINSDGIYTIKIKYKTYYDDEAYSEYAMLTVKAALREDNGRRYWALHSMTIKEIPAETTTEPTTAKKSDDYMAAYNSYLKNYDFVAKYGDESFGFVYINNDDIPELVISEGTSHASAATVATYVNGKVVEVGCFGSNGNFSYVERGSIIISEYAGMGIINIAVYKMKANGTSEKIFSCENNEANEGAQPLKYIVNDVEVSKEVYAQEYEKNYPKNTKSYFDGTYYEVTTANIDKYCS